LQEAARAGVSHVVFISIVGVDRNPHFPYYRAKLDAESVVERSPVPWTILRATQFHELLLGAGRFLDRLPGGTRVNWRTRPAMKTEEFFETIWSLARDGKTNEMGVPNLLQVAVIAREYAGEVRLASPPLLVQRALFAVLAPVGRLLGYRARYPRSTADEYSRLS
jgi:uncharacterized protein YbjT (DUF2867 family)